MISLRKIQLAITEIIKKNYGSSPEAIQHEVTVYLKKLNLGNEYLLQFKKFVKDQEKEITNQYMSANLQGRPEIARAKETILQISESNISDLSNRVLRDVTRAIDEGIRDGKDYKTLVSDTIRKVTFKHGSIQTEIETASAALDTAIRVNTYSDAYGDEAKLTLYGPAPERPWSKAHFEKTYTIAELKNMINDFGQPALYYRGGWNCKHRWG